MLKNKEVGTIIHIAKLRAALILEADSSNKELIEYYSKLLQKHGYRID